MKLVLNQNKIKKHNNKIDTQISISFSTIIIFLNYFPQYKVAEPWGCIELEMDRKMPVFIVFFAAENFVSVSIAMSK